MSDASHANLRRLPAVGALVTRLKERHAAAAGRGGALLTFLARRLVAAARKRVLTAGRLGGNLDFDLDRMADELFAELEAFGRSSTRRVVNATGIILHSGLGRAVLASEVMDEVAAMSGYCLLEVSDEDGARRKRDAFCEELLVELTGAEAALVVNNNAAATLLILDSMARGREVVVSRSQMIEIGGSFRLPDVFEASGCRLREVGTTNRSYVEDYDRAIGPETAALALVHTSNYRIVGFSEHVGLEALTALGRSRGLPVIHDLGSGSLFDLAALGIHDEPPVADSVRAGADVVCFSGDKLIGGPQAGIIIGRREWVERIRRNPMARAMRIDKITAVGLETTLKLHLEPESLLERHPTLRMLNLDPSGIAARAAALAAAIRSRVGESIEVDLAESTSELGAGTLPTHGLPTTCVRVRSAAMATEELARRLRMQPVSVFTRVRDERVWFDPRTLQVGEDELVVRALQEALAPAGPPEDRGTGDQRR